MKPRDPRVLVACPPDSESLRPTVSKNPAKSFVDLVLRGLEEEEEALLGLDDEGEGESETEAFLSQESLEDSLLGEATRILPTRPVDDDLCDGA